MTTQTQPASAADLLRVVRERISRRWTSGEATDVLLALRSEHCARACMAFTRVNGKQIAQFEDQASHAEMLQAIDRAIELAEREVVA